MPPGCRNRVAKRMRSRDDDASESDDALGCPSILLDAEEKRVGGNQHQWDSNQCGGMQRTANWQRQARVDVPVLIGRVDEKDQRCDCSYENAGGMLRVPQSLKAGE